MRVLHCAEYGLLEVARCLSTFRSLPDFTKRPVEVDYPVIFVKDAMSNSILASKGI